MQIVEIRVSELSGFVGGKLWQNCSPKPITALRAVSQAQNPRANPDDIALIVAIENDSLLGLVGLLPDLINGNPSEKAHSNSGWWAHPEKGKHLAVPLFMKAFSVCNQRMFMTDCTPHTMQILEKTNWFDFPENQDGRRGFLKFNFHEILPVKIPATRKISSVLKLSDQILNALLVPLRKITSAKFLKSGIHCERVDSISPEVALFLETHSKNEFTRRSAADLNWILRCPWIIGKNQQNQASPVDYPFSYLTETFSQELFQLSENGKITGFLFVSIRDGHMKIPYVYFDDQHTAQVLQEIYRLAILKMVSTITIFNRRLVLQMDSAAHPFLFRKKIKRLMAISKQLSDKMEKYPEFQDGDGDIVFT